MNKAWISHSISFFFFTLLQVLLFFNFNLYEYGFAFVYIGFILFLPLQTPAILMLLLAFIQGLTIDMFYNTMGMHAFTLVLITYIKPKLAKFLIPRMIDDINDLQSISQLGFQRLSVFIITLSFIHHFVLFSFLNGFWDNFFLNVLIALVSAVITSICILIFSQLFFKSK